MAEIADPSEIFANIDNRQFVLEDYTQFTQWEFDFLINFNSQVPSWLAYKLGQRIKDSLG